MDRRETIVGGWVATVAKEQIDPWDRYVPTDGRGQTPFLSAIVTRKSVSAVIPGGIAFRVMGLLEQEEILPDFIHFYCIVLYCIVRQAHLL